MVDNFCNRWAYNLSCLINKRGWHVITSCCFFHRKSLKISNNRFMRYRFKTKLLTWSTAKLTSDIDSNSITSDPTSIFRKTLRAEHASMHKAKAIAASKVRYIVFNLVLTKHKPLVIFIRIWSSHLKPGFKYPILSTNLILVQVAHVWLTLLFHVLA